MAYDYGSQTLGINNPFRFEGVMRIIAGVIIAVMGVVPLISVASQLKQDPIMGYTLAFLGAVLLIAGIRIIGAGMFQLFRYFVGRSVPTSLAFNEADSEKENAKAEKNSVLYTEESLHSMLMGRKNTTFIEPRGWVARFVHSLFPKLTFLPYPLRNLAQTLASLAIDIVVAITVFMVAWFVVSSGLAGEKAGLIAMPMLSLLLLIYISIIWLRTSGQQNSISAVTVQSEGSWALAPMLVMAILIPIGAGFALDAAPSALFEQIQTIKAEVDIFNALPNLLVFFAVTALVFGLALPGLIARMKMATPTSAVAEYRDNFQEKVHPKELFINMDTMILANRRYKEIPNRIYKPFNTNMRQQADGKGSFFGNVMIETQPAVASDTQLPRFAKVLATVGASASLVISSALFLWLGYQLAGFINSIVALQLKGLSFEQLAPIVSAFNSIVFTLFAFFAVRAGSKILSAASHLYWGELHFSSLLMWAQIEGTYNESKMSLGRGMNDSNLTENKVVNSSITPWFVSTRATTSIFATSGEKNLEHPRFLMSMQKNQAELDTIINELKTSLANRQYVASMNDKNTEEAIAHMHKMNEGARANTTGIFAIDAMQQAALAQQNALEEQKES